MILRTIFFLAINFFGLWIGSAYTSAVTGSWYANLERAPWEPPGWVFGAAWTIIMILFSIYLARAAKYLDKKELKVLYLTFAGSWVLNVIWNPVFFEFKLLELALFVIIALMLFIIRFLQVGRREMKWEWTLVIPYLLWIIIATSLNAYIIAYNS
jgi:benzodiazapine receptor